MTKKEKKIQYEYFKKSVIDGRRTPISAMMFGYGDVSFTVICPHCYEMSGFRGSGKRSEVNCLHCKEEFEVDWNGMEDIFNENENLSK